MTINQISVFVENKPGALAKITSTLANAGIDVRALSVADTQDFGILRMIVDNPEKAKKALNDAGVGCSIKEVFAAEVPDERGAMTQVLEQISETGLNIEYMYAFVSPKNKKAYIVLRIKDTEGALAALKKNGIKLADDYTII